ncbi:MAG: hypothetical protein WC595_06325 [Candidatus Nanoarchaeia archaeon]
MDIVGINEEDVAKAIRRGSKTKQTEGFLTCYTYYCVAYIQIGFDDYKIKTVYLTT